MESWYELVGQYGYISIVIILGIGIIGLPVPDEVLLAYLGYVASIGELNILWTIVFSYLGAICGITLSFILGYKLGKPFLLKYGSRLFIRRGTINRTETLFTKYGSYVLIFCYFIPGVRHIAAYLAGITSYSYKRFSLIAYIGAFVWVNTFLFLGYHLNTQWTMIAQLFSKYMWTFIGGLLLVIGVVISYLKVVKERTKTNAPF